MKKSTHESGTLHSAVLEQVKVLCGMSPEFSADVRSSLYQRGRTPDIELVLGEGETRDANGIAKLWLNSDGTPVLTWRVRNFTVAPRLSLDPTTHYLNGLQQMSADGVVVGHAHLHTCENREWEHAVRSAAFGSEIPRPPSYRFIGGLKWYREVADSDTDPQGPTLVIGRPKGVPVYKTDGTIYVLDFQLVTIDDTFPPAALHGEPSPFRLTSLATFKVRT